MSTHQEAPTVYCEIVDGCRKWKQTWSDLALRLDLPTPVHTDYVIHRVEDPDVWDEPCGFSKSDLFTMNFFASEVYHLGESARNYLFKALTQAKTGSILLVNDNNIKACCQWIDNIASSAGFETLWQDSGNRKICDAAERKSALGAYADKFNFNPKLTGKVASRVFRKA